MTLQGLVYGVLRWCFGEQRLVVPTLLLYPSIEGSETLPMQVYRPVSTHEVAPTTAEVHEATQTSPTASQSEMFSKIMRCVWAMARERVFSHYAGARCMHASRYLSEPEIDAWGALAMILSVTRAWVQETPVDTLRDEGEMLTTLTGIVSVCLKFACEEGIGSIIHRDTEIGVEIQILGMLSGHDLTNWLEAVYLHTEQLQTILDAEVIAVARRAPLFSHYVDNAQARAERLLFELHRSSDQPEDFNTHALYKALRALPTFFFACVYDDLFLLQLPERHAPAIVFAILGSGDYMMTVAAQSGLVVAESREVLAA
eukprot:304477-Prymnesium_polylepis.1